jgi:hypothetical protein
MAEDLRRLGAIVVSQEARGVYQLKINGVLCASVEWSPKRGMWCIEDARGMCLMHVEGIVGEDADADNAIHIAKTMIRNGSMPMPEKVEAELREREQLGEPIPPADLEKEKVVTSQVGDRAEELGEPIEMGPRTARGRPRKGQVYRLPESAS